VLAVASAYPLVAPYVVQLALCALAFGSLALVPETRPPRPRDETSVPQLGPAARRAFVAAALTSGIVWWLASLFISILPAFVATLLGVRSPALQGALALVVFAVSPLAQIVGRRNVPTGFAARAGLIGTVLALAAMLGAVPAHSLALFALGSFLAGVAHGLGFLGAQSTIQPHRAARCPGALVGALLRDHLRLHRCHGTGRWRPDRVGRLVSSARCGRRRRGGRRADVGRYLAAPSTSRSVTRETVARAAAYQRA